MDNKLFEDWIAKSKIAPEVVLAIKPLMEGFDKSDMFLNLAVKGAGWDAQRMVKALKSQLLSNGVDFSAVDALVPSASASAAVPLPVALPAVSTPAPVTPASAVPTLDPAGATQAAVIPSATPASTGTPAPQVIKPPKAATSSPAVSATPAQGGSRSRAGKARFDWSNVLSKVGFGKKNGGSAAAGSTQAKSSLMGNKKVVIVIAGSVIALALMVAGYMMFGGSSSSQAYVDPNAESVIGGTLPGTEAAQSPDTQTVMPEVKNPTPLDIASNPWMKSLQIMIITEFLGILFFLFADAMYRKQVSDALIATIMAGLTIFFLPPGTTLLMTGVLLMFEIGFVSWVSFAGGRDLTPIGGYFLLVGVFGGLIVGRMAVLEGLLTITHAPVLPLSQLATEFVLKHYSVLAYPLLVYFVIVIGLGFSMWEVFRPSEDGNPPYGTFSGAGVGLLIYFLMYAFIPLVGYSWLWYIVSVSLSIAVTTFFQKERKIQTITVKWGTRSPFDAGMLITAVLILLQVVLAVAG